MKHKGGTHETLSLVFQHDGVPPTMVTNDSKEQTKGEFQSKLKEADYHPQVTEPYSPWQQAAEGCICELKRGSSQKMIKTGSPKCLWYHCLELEAYVRSCTSDDIYMTTGQVSCTSNDIYMATGQVSETIMTGNITAISHTAEFVWYNWVMFYDNELSYPDDKLILGRYIGPAIDTALTAKILKSCLPADLPCSISLLKSLTALFTKT
jgi:hypothetical protein